MTIVYRAQYTPPKGLFAAESFHSTIQKAYEEISYWLSNTVVADCALTPYRGYLNRLKGGDVFKYSDVIADENDSSCHIFTIEEVEIL